ncbi:hypothetical protein GCM10025866_04120 [Naasia aerilata]|uniref:WXG100 family type VII secretion target n=1 Tax=Naasia aerilata TaxID=1162966 RepID=A0ABN6XHV8_9MICO|nr:hypothetical protein GCM10025866_04120 [Naasia aerilata]
MADLRIAGDDAAGRDDLRDAVKALDATAGELDAIVAEVWERLSPSTDGDSKSSQQGV